MLIMTVIVRVKPLKRQEFLQVLHSLYINREEEKGLKKSMLYQEMNDPNSFRLIVELETRRNLERHLNGEKFGVLLGALELLCAESQIRYSYTPEKGAEVLKSEP
jgi:quinol monooxygenase YgiN